MLVGLLLVACSDGVGGSLNSAGSSNNQQSQPNPSPTPTPTPVPTPSPSPNPGDPTKLSICSKLDFSNLDWPDAVDARERNAFALALNISGSFEGSDGWENLTNNFDGQGLSLGLLNQCLGQGSLQPLLIQMRNLYTNEMKSVMSQANFNSMLAMLNAWETTLTINDFTPSDASLRAHGFSKLDDPAMIEKEIGFNPEVHLMANLTSKNQNSVNWAVANLYNGSSFKSDWKKQLIALSGSPGYRSIQVAAALDLHLEAIDLFKTYGLTQLRSYLFMFDIVVQNGGISATAKANIMAQFRANPNWSETQKLNAILTERLKYVKAAYVADVRSRKQSLINGNGTVHGAHRDYGVEYCSVFAAPMP